MVFGRGNHRNFVAEFIRTLDRAERYRSPNAARLSWITQHSSIIQSGDARVIKEEYTKSIKLWILDLAEKEAADPDVIAQMDKILEQNQHVDFLSFCDQL